MLSLPFGKVSYNFLVWTGDMESAYFDNASMLKGVSLIKVSGVDLGG
jgi:hypothetical protein